MQSATSTVLSTLHAVQAFMTTHADALGNLNSSSSRQDLDDIEAALSKHALTQAASRSGGKSARTRQRVSKNTLLVKYLRPISAISLAKLSQSPDFAALKLPKSTRSVPQLVAAAGAMGDAAAKYAETFVSAGMAPTFIADLKSAVHEVLAAEASRGNTLSAGMGATSALKVQTKQALKVVKQLDSLIEPLLANDPALLVKWKATKRFTGKAPGISAAASDAGQTVSATPAEGTTASTPSVQPVQPVASSAPVTAVQAVPLVTPTTPVVPVARPAIPSTPAAPVQTTA